MPDEPVVVEAHRTQLERVVINLAVNGGDAMPDGGPLEIAVGTTVDAATGAPEAVLTVTDAGLGMDRRHRDRIFDPYFTTKGDGGTGLGLATVQRIVGQLGGRSRCAPTPGGLLVLGAPARSRLIALRFAHARLRVLRRHRAVAGDAPRAADHDRRRASCWRSSTAGCTSASAAWRAAVWQLSRRTPCCTTSSHLGFLELREQGLSMHEIDLELASRAAAAMGLREAIADPEMPVAIADRLRADGIVLHLDHEAVAGRRRAKSPAELAGHPPRAAAAEAGLARRGRRASPGRAATATG